MQLETPSNDYFRPSQQRVADVRRQIQAGATVEVGHESGSEVLPFKEFAGVGQGNLGPEGPSQRRGPGKRRDLGLQGSGPRRELVQDRTRDRHRQLFLLDRGRRGGSSEKPIEQAEEVALQTFDSAGRGSTASTGSCGREAEQVGTRGRRRYRRSPPRRRTRPVGPAAARTFSSRGASCRSFPSGRDLILNRKALPIQSSFDGVGPSSGLRTASPSGCYPRRPDLELSPPPSNLPPDTA